MISVREMTLAEVGLRIRYFHEASPEHLETLGVDPTRIPSPEEWQRHYDEEYALPIERRTELLVVWESDREPIGFSTANKIVFGRQANMHLHILNPDQRRKGFGAACVSETVKIYFERLRLERLFCEPNAFNVAPNRTLQRAGFKYVKTYRTVPDRLNYHQAVTQWVLERGELAG